MEKKKFQQAYLMGLLCLLGLAGGYLAIEFAINPLSLEVMLSSPGAWFWLAGLLIAGALAPALLIARRDEHHFGWSAAVRWLIFGLLLGLYLRAITFLIPDVAAGASTAQYLMNRALTWGLIALGLAGGYTLFFRRTK